MHQLAHLDQEDGKEKLLVINQLLILNNLNPIKRPVSAVADNLEVRNAKIITIKINKNIKFNLLYQNRSLQKKLNLNKLRRETN